MDDGKLEELGVLNIFSCLSKVATLNSPDDETVGNRELL